MNRVSFVDNNGNAVYGVIALRGVTPIAGAGGQDFLNLEDGTYTFKLLGFKDYTLELSNDVEIALEEQAFGFDEVNVSAFYQNKTWILALVVVLLGWSIMKLRE